MMCWSMKAGRVLAPMLLTVSAVLVPLSAASPLHAQVSPGPHRLGAQGASGAQLRLG